ncbi:MAG TPA: hypothetical protein VK915_14100 [Gaiellaceae bacterium]|nr:hypothetical protein [Gaiellaceae bacterium]
MRARGALAIAVLVSTAGCAGRDDGDEAAFRKAAEEVCADDDEKIETEAPPDLFALAASSTEIADLLEGQQAEL